MELDIIDLQLSVCVGIKELCKEARVWGGELLTIENTSRQNGGTEMLMLSALVIMEIGNTP